MCPGRGHAVNEFVKNVRTLLLPNLCFFTSPVHMQYKAPKLHHVCCIYRVHLWGLANVDALGVKLLGI